MQNGEERFFFFLQNERARETRTGITASGRPEFSEYMQNPSNSSLSEGEKKKKEKEKAALSCLRNIFWLHSVKITTSVCANSIQDENTEWTVI